MSKKVKTMSIIPAPTEAAIQPKPTRSEIVEALTRLKVEEMTAKNELNRTAFELQKQFCQQVAAKAICELDLTSLFDAEKAEAHVNRGSSNYVEFTIRIAESPEKVYGYRDGVNLQASKELVSELRKLEKSPGIDYINEDRIRKEIRASLSRDSAGRVSRLLSDVESRAALSDLLKVVEAGVEKRLN